MVVQLKCCPKCVGDVFLEPGVDGEEWVCIQCGYRYDGLVISRMRVLNGGRRVGIVQVAEAFDVRFDRAVDGDLSRTQWASASRPNRRLLRPRGSALPGPHDVQAVEPIHLADHKRKVTTLRGAA